MSAVYQFGPIALHATLELPELRRAAPGELPTVYVEQHDAMDRRTPVWYHAWVGTDGEDWLRIGRNAGGYCLEFPGLADFALSADGQHVLACARDASPETFRHLLLDQVMPLVLAHQGWCVLHAAAVAGSAGGAAFLGSTGQGKSTIAASLASSGLAAITDDTLILTPGSGRGVTGHPAYTSLRMWPETAQAVFGLSYRHDGRVSEFNEKVRLGPAGGLEFVSAGTPLHAFYVLTPDPSIDAPRVETIAPRDRIMEVVRHAFVLDWKGPDRLRAAFDAVSQVVNRVAVRRLRFRHDYRELTMLRQVILEDLRQAA